jgi:hypothetical protein
VYALHLYASVVCSDSQVLQQAHCNFMYQLARSPVTLSIIGDGRQDILRMLHFIQKNPLANYDYIWSWRWLFKEYTGIQLTGCCASLYAAATNR